jgi:4-hydroxybenzoate polyprenyltransferase
MLNPSLTRQISNEGFSGGTRGFFRKLGKAITLLGILIRFDEWYDSKLPLLACCGLSIALLSSLPWSISVVNFLLSFLFCAFLLSFGYTLNDCSDIKEDRIAGKNKLIHQLTSSERHRLIAILLAICYVVLAPFYRDVLVLLTVSISILAATFYSLPPIRLKERGILGVVFASVAQRTFPLLVVATVFQYFGPVVLGWMIIGFLVGVRYVLIHQNQDKSNDLMTQTTTFATEHPQIIPFIVIVTFFLEIACLIAQFFLLIRSETNLLIVPVSYLILSFIYYSLFTRVYRPRMLLSFSHVPLADLYALVLPISLSIFLFIKDWRWSFLLPLEYLWLKRFAHMHYFPVYRLIRDGLLTR